MCAFAARMFSTVTSPAVPSSAIRLPLSRSSIAILASPNSSALSAIWSRASSDIFPGYSAYSALSATMALSSSHEYLSNFTMVERRNVDADASSIML